MPGADSTTLPDSAFAILLALTFAAVLAGAIALIAGGLVQRLLKSVEGPARGTPLRGAPLRLVRLLAFVVSMMALVFPALTMVGVELPEDLSGDRLGHWVTRTGLRIGVILLLALTTSRLVVAIIARAEREMEAGAGPADVERRKRAQTISVTFSRVLTVTVWVVALLMVLRALDVDITPVLTGAGILGLAVGFGAQTLVKDVISGFFLIVENQVRVGDVVLVNGVGGSVEQINLRTIVMRDMEGTVHIIPNGEIRTLANRSKDFSFFVLDIAIDFDDDMDAAVAAVQEAAASMMDDATFGPHILEPVETLGVDKLEAAAVTLRFRVKTRPLSQWLVGRELRKRVKRAFGRHGVRFPAQRMVVSVKQSIEQ